MINADRKEVGCENIRAVGKAYFVGKEKSDHRYGGRAPHMVGFSDPFLSFPVEKFDHAYIDKKFIPFS